MRFYLDSTMNNLEKAVREIASRTDVIRVGCKGKAVNVAAEGSEEAVLGTVIVIEGTRKGGARIVERVPVKIQSEDDMDTEVYCFQSKELQAGIGTAGAFAALYPDDGTDVNYDFGTEGLTVTVGKYPVNIRYAGDVSDVRGAVLGGDEIVTFICGRDELLKAVRTAGMFGTINTKNSTVDAVGMQLLNHKGTNMLHVYSVTVTGSTGLAHVEPKSVSGGTEGFIGEDGVITPEQHKDFLIPSKDLADFLSMIPDNEGCVRIDVGSGAYKLTGSGMSITGNLMDGEGCKNLLDKRLTSMSFGVILQATTETLVHVFKAIAAKQGVTRTKKVLPVKITIGENQVRFEGYDGTYADVPCVTKFKDGIEAKPIYMLPEGWNNLMGVTAFAEGVKICIMYGKSGAALLRTNPYSYDAESKKMKQIPVLLLNGSLAPADAEQRFAEAGRAAAESTETESDEDDAV